MINPFILLKEHYILDLASLWKAIILIRLILEYLLNQTILNLEMKLVILIKL